MAKPGPLFALRGRKRPGRHVALYLDGGMVEVGAELGERFVGNERVHCSGLPAGRVATITHFGPYARLGDAHSELRRWCAEHGHRLSNVCWEIYGHWDESWNADPSKIRTDVFHLLENGPNQVRLTRRAGFSPQRATHATRWYTSTKAPKFY